MTVDTKHSLNCHSKRSEESIDCKHMRSLAIAQDDRAYYSLLTIHHSHASQRTEP